MCGIAGFVGVRERPSAALEAVEAMVGSLARRGPDSEGVSSWPNAVLGHRRLAILDLSPAGAQPMLSDDGEIGVVFNGCVYNFQELKRELEAHGHRFRSGTDTEVLVRGYQQWGAEAMAPKLRGMFAFGIWDNRENKLVLVRDRLGVKPLVYTVRNGTLAFASTVTALKDAGLAGEVNPAAVLEFLEFTWVGDEQTIYSGVRKVEAATMIEWRGGVVKETRYWTPPEPGSRVIRFEEALERTEELLLEAVRLRLIADVPVGLLLSGGIDSALVAWAVSKQNANLKSFTVGAPGHPSDESARARATARVLGVPHEVIELSPNEQPAMSDLITAYGEPFACSSALAMLRVCQAVKPKVTVLLTGDGGDDVFLGYTHHRNFWIAQRMAQRLPRSFEKLWPVLRRGAALLPWLRRPMHLTDYAMGGLGAVTRIHDGLPYLERAGILGERLDGQLLPHRQIAQSMNSGRHLMEEFLDYERRTRFVSEYMTKVDGAAMHYAIEARSPFLDHVLWEMAASLPIGLRLRGGEKKALLRALVSKHVSPEVANAPKQGFTVPMNQWLAGAWKSQLEALRSGGSALAAEGWVREPALRKAVSAALDGGNAPVQLWSLVVLENWLRASRKPTGAFPVPA